MAIDEVGRAARREQRLTSAKVIAVLRVYGGVLLALPPIAGYAIIAVVLFGGASEELMASGAALCATLLVAVLLILVPPILYIINADDYNEYMAALEKRGKELAGAPTSRSS